MNIQSNIKMSSWLFGGILVAYLLAELTGHILFSWIAMSKLIWLSMKIYWVSVCVIAYWYDQESIPSSEEISIRPEAISHASFAADRPILQMKQKSNEESSRWN